MGRARPFVVVAISAFYHYRELYNIICPVFIIFQFVNTLFICSLSQQRFSIIGLHTDRRSRFGSVRTVGSRREAALTLAALRADAAAVAVAASSAALSRRRFYRSDRRGEQRFVVAAPHGNPFVSIVNQTKVSSLARVSETISNRILSEEMWPLYHVEGA